MPFEGGNGGNLLAAALQTSVPRACPLRRGDLLFGSAVKRTPGLPFGCAAKRTPGLPFGCAAKRSAEILIDSHFLPSIPRVGCLQRRVYSSSFIRPVWTEYVKL
ncbi:hypothetical protein Taro_041927 [Colocasia esculenta]|uniref:Uncharacterized protein n=1 Tax=Colocasia esculenta TaxID=4460 RepID=A0A843WX72_COLES|nr:hypothetical protein [Colocasia esculenta]